MKMNKKGFLAALLKPEMLFSILIIAALIFGVMKWAGNDESETLSFNSGGTTPQNDDPITGAPLSCDGLASITEYFNDLDMYNGATDPACTLTITEMNGNPFYETTADDGNDALEPLSSFKGIYCAEDASHFSELISFDTVCSNKYLQSKARATLDGTVTSMNTNGATVNTDAADEAMATSTTYTHTQLMRSAGDGCASRHGAVIACEYDGTYVNDLKSSLPAYTGAIRTAHVTNQSGAEKDFDMWEAFLFSGELCDSELAQWTLSVEATATANGEDQANVHCYWYPRGYYVDAETLAAEGPSLYDESNTILAQTAGTVDWYVYSS